MKAVENDDIPYDAQHEIAVADAMVYRPERPRVVAVRRALHGARQLHAVDAFVDSLSPVAQEELSADTMEYVVTSFFAGGARGEGGGGTAGFAKTNIAGRKGSRRSSAAVFINAFWCRCMAETKW